MDIFYRCPYTVSVFLPRALKDAEERNESAQEHTRRLEEIGGLLKDLQKMKLEPHHRLKHNRTHLVTYFTSTTANQRRVRWNRTRWGPQIWELEEKVKEAFIQFGEPKEDGNDGDEPNPGSADHGKNYDKTLKQFDGWEAPPIACHDDTSDTESDSSVRTSQVLHEEGSALDLVPAVTSLKIDPSTGRPDSSLNTLPSSDRLN
jgi:hypothetical protein